MGHSRQKRGGVITFYAPSNVRWVSSEAGTGILSCVTLSPALEVGVIIMLTYRLGSEAQKKEGR